MTKVAIILLCCMPAYAPVQFVPPPDVYMPIPPEPGPRYRYPQCPPGPYCYQEFRGYGGHPQQEEQGPRMCRNVYGYVVPCDSLRGPNLPH